MVCVLAKLTNSQIKHAEKPSTFQTSLQSLSLRFVLPPGSFRIIVMSYNLCRSSLCLNFQTNKLKISYSLWNGQHNILWDVINCTEYGVQCQRHLSMRWILIFWWHLVHCAIQPLHLRFYTPIITNTQGPSIHTSIPLTLHPVFWRMA